MSSANPFGLDMIRRDLEKPPRMIGVFTDNLIAPSDSVALGFRLWDSGPPAKYRHPKGHEVSLLPHYPKEKRGPGPVPGPEPPPQPDAEMEKLALMEAEAWVERLTWAVGTIEYAESVMSVKGADPQLYRKMPICRLKGPPHLQIMGPGGSGRTTGPRVPQDGPAVDSFLGGRMGAPSRGPIVTRSPRKGGRERFLQQGDATGRRAVPAGEDLQIRGFFFSLLLGWSTSGRRH